MTLSNYVCLSVWNEKSKMARLGNMQSLKEKEKKGMETQDI